MSIWDDPDLRVGGDYVSFENVGDTIAGTVNAIRAHRFNPNEAAVPQILLTTDGGDDKTVTAGQIRLKLALAEQRPEPGDHITITLTDVEKRQGGKTLKHFDVTVKRGGGAASSATPAAVQAAPDGVDPAVAQALANLSAEQRKAMGLPAA